MRHFSWLRNLIPIATGSSRQIAPDRQDECCQADAYRHDEDEDRAREQAKYHEDLLYMAFLGPHV
jgi:hypothetical protein